MTDVNSVPTMQPNESLASCPNCCFSLQLPGLAPEAVRHCPSCGQETTLHPPSVAEFLHEFVGHYVALEGPLWRTLWLLVRHPGRLTADYLAGKRRQYVAPLRLYLSASFILFLVLKLLAPVAGPTLAAVPLPAVTASASSVDASSLDAQRGNSTLQVIRASAPPQGVSQPTTVMARPESGARTPGTTKPRSTPYAWFTHGLSLAPYALFLMLPVFAGVIAIAYSNRRRTFGEHLVFALHGQTFAFLLAAALALATPTHDGGSALLFMPFYGFVALRRVYGGGWWQSLMRLLAIMVSNTVLLCLVTGVVAVWLFAH